MNAVAMRVGDSYIVPESERIAEHRRIEAEDAACPAVEQKDSVDLTQPAILHLLTLANDFVRQLVHDQATGRITTESFLAESRSNSECLRALTARVRK